MVIDQKKTVAGYVLHDLPQQAVEQLAAVSRVAAGEGIVLLQNKDNLLPFQKGQRVSVFGRIQSTYYKSGTGSGGMVNAPYVTNILDSLRENPKVEVNEELASVYAEWIKTHPFDVGKGWAQEPWCQEEMPLAEEIAKQAAAKSDVALIIIGRTAGEDKDNSVAPGSYLLTKTEEEMLKTVTSVFDKVCVVVNSGNMIDNSFVDQYENIKSLLYVWQGGQEGGHAAADVLCGDVTPSGKLSDTFAYHVSDYPSDANFGAEDENKYTEDIYVGYRYFETFAPEKVQYPFGFGLSYTTFSVKTTGVTATADTITLDVTVQNTGDIYSGKEVVQVYFGAPQGVLGKPVKQLCTYAKTKLLAPGESQSLQLSFPIHEMASYDDGGKTGNKSCYVLEAGDYVIFAGTDVRSAQPVFTYTVDNLVVTKQLTEALAPVKAFDRMCPQAKDGSFQVAYEPVPTRTIDLQQRIRENRPADIAYTGDKGIKLLDVYDGKASLEDFIAQISDRDLACFVHGEGMNSPKVTIGTGAAFGGITPQLASFGIPVVCATDGPSGVRMDGGGPATAMPNGTLLACTWNDALTQELYVLEGVEMYAYRIDALLGPGMNIHRHPMNGRNFEYFSEDPLLTGKIAAAITRGISQCGTTATIKHFIANNQEISRSFADSVISERAIREIYLKGFEIAVKEGNAKALMTSYNPVNGIWSAGNYDLNTTVLRGEWGYDGMVMTDWWAKMNEEGKPADVKNLKCMVRAQNDIFMVCPTPAEYGDNILQGLKEGFITRGELQRCAMNLFRFILQTPAFEHYVENGCQPPVFETDTDADRLEVVTIGEPESDKTVSFQADEKGEYVIALEMVSDADPLAQMTVVVKINEKELVYALNGTSGKTVVQKARTELKQGENQLCLTFNEIVRVLKVHILH